MRIALLILRAKLISSILDKAWSNVNSKLSPSFKNKLHITRKIIGYLNPILFGIVLYHLWMWEWMITSFYNGDMLIKQIIVNIEKESTYATLNQTIDI